MSRLRHDLNPTPWERSNLCHASSPIPIPERSRCLSNPFDHYQTPRRTAFSPGHYLDDYGIHSSTHSPTQNLKTSPFDEQRMLGNTVTTDALPTPAHISSHGFDDDVLTPTNYNYEGFILKGAPSGGNSSTRHGRRSDSIVTNPYDEARTANAIFSADGCKDSEPWKESPTPSIKRRTAEKFLQEHGSPPGIRVTCGGRIVPDGLAPLTSPMFPHIFSSKRPYINNDHKPWQQLPYTSGNASAIVPPTGFVAFDVNGQLCQYVNGRAEPLRFKHGVPQYIVPIPNSFPPVGNDLVHSESQYLPGLAGMPLAADDGGMIEPIASLHAQIKALEAERNVLQSELRELERYSAMYQRQLGQQSQTGIVQKRIDLTNRIDETRKALLALKDENKGTENAEHTVEVSRYGFQAPGHNAAPGQHPHVPMNPQNTVEELYPSPLDWVEHTNYGPKLLTYGADTTQYGFYPSPIIGGYYTANKPAGDDPHKLNVQGRTSSAGLGITNLEKISGKSEVVDDIPEGADTHRQAQSMKIRRSHAIEIKRPPMEEENGREKKTGLNPSSSTYYPTASGNEPSAVEHNRKIESPSVDSAPLIAEMRGDLNQALVIYDARVKDAGHRDTHMERRESESSVNTADFFPRNTFEFSNHKHLQYRGTEMKAEKQDTNYGAIGTPVTPRKSPHRFAWHSSPADNYVEDTSLVDISVQSEERKNRAPSNRPVAPPPSIEGDLMLRNVSAPTVRRYEVTPTKSEQHSSSPWLYTPHGSTDRQAPRAAAVEMTPVSKLLNEASVRVANLEDGDDLYLRGYQDGLHHYLKKLDQNIAAWPGATVSKATLADATESLNVHALQTVTNALPSPHKVMTADVDRAENDDNAVAKTWSRRQAGTQTSRTFQRKRVPPPIVTQGLTELSMKGGGPLGRGYEGQRFTKAQITINPSHAHARGVFQYDGSTGETAQRSELSYGQLPGSYESPRSSSSKRVKNPEPPRSPIRDRASAAYAKVGRLVSSPEKDKWRTLWKKRFTDLKEAESRGMDSI